jgi:hypothetical protein
MDYKEPKPIDECETVVDFAYRNRHKHLTKAEAFQHTFGVPLKKFFRDYLVGFDIIAFNEWIGASDKCLRDVVAKKYDEKAVELIQSLI